MSSASSPGMRASMSKSPTNNPSGSAIQSAIVTMTWCMGLAGGSAINRSRCVCLSQACNWKTRVQAVVELLPCDDLGQHEDAGPLQAEIFKRAPDLPRSSPCRHNDRPRPDNVDAVIESKGGNGVTEGVKIGNAHEPRSTRCDHRSSGRRSDA